jgi:predicted component of type VI protein secretion system
LDIQLFVKTKSDGAVRTFKFPAGPPVVIGRNPEAVVPLEGSALSRDHFSIEYRGDSVYVTDTSSNGTWVNGELIGRGKSKAVGVADLVEVAGYEINYKLLGGPEQSPPQTAVPATSPARSGASAPPAWMRFLDPARKFVGPFGRAEKMAVVLILCAAALTLIYFYS